MKLDRSKRMIDAYQRWKVSDKWGLGDCYKDCSREKHEAWLGCLDLMCEFNGQCGRVVGYNSSSFSYGFVFIHEKTGEECFMWITKDSARYCPLAICDKE